MDAELDPAIRPANLALLERSWGPTRLDLFNRLQANGADRKEFPQSLHWDWARKLPDLKLLEATGYGIFADERWQGAMLTKTVSMVSQAPVTKGMPLVYIDYLEAAPWNWSVPALDVLGEFKGVGSLLVRRAVLQSVAEGFSGRVGLHALPQAEEFYASVFEMDSFGHDPTKQNLMYFELSSEVSARILNDEGGDG